MLMSGKKFLNVRTEQSGVAKIPLRSIFKVSTEPSDVNFLHKIISPQTHAIVRR